MDFRDPSPEHCGGVRQGAVQCPASSAWAIQHRTIFTVIRSWNRLEPGIPLRSRESLFDLLRDTVSGVVVSTKHQDRKKPHDGFSPRLVAPCGIDCRVCIAYLREKNPCLGCRRDQRDKPKTRSQCKIKLCENLGKGLRRFCFECDTFPCARLRGMDLRYRTKYRLSVIENLAAIKRDGIRIFVQHETNRWRCPQCGNVLCVHRDRCLFCGAGRATKE